ncbi:MAG: hypothetical protein NTU93_07765 [Arthrobacter sp.]|nr:hypothetical protein [Arthrobacter sp.]
MALDRSALRTDIGYLSRRRKPAAQPEPAVPSSRSAAPASGAAASGGLTLGAPPAVSGGLTLGVRPARAPSTSAAAVSTRGPRPAPAVSDRLFPAPDFGSLRELGEANPVVRLNPRQSAIGSLLVAGARSVAWEDNRLTTGAQHAEGLQAGTPVSTAGNRPLAGLQDGAGIVSLRHVRLLRRVLFVAGETPLTIGVFDGAAAAVAARNHAGLRSVLYVVRVGAVLELRAEFVPADAPDAAIWARFGFTMTIPLDQRVLLR